jgi:hypothetical protein
MWSRRRGKVWDFGRFVPAGFLVAYRAALSSAGNCSLTIAEWYALKAKSFFVAMWL